MEIYKSSMLTLEVEEDDASIIIKWLGKSVDREPGVFIIPIMTKVMERSSDTKKVIMDFCALEFMNSSTFTPVSKIMETAKAGNIQLQILYKQSVNWQELSFSALRIFETRDKRIEITGR
jgi:hypothetical protein